VFLYAISSVLGSHNDPISVADRWRLGATMATPDQQHANHCLFMWKVPRHFEINEGLNLIGIILTASIGVAALIVAYLTYRIHQARDRGMEADLEENLGDLSVIPPREHTPTPSESGIATESGR